MKTKWILLVGVIVVVVCLIGVGAYFFLVFSPLFFISDYRVGPSLPPVDISGINISSALTAEELLPDQLMNESLNRETVDTSAIWGIRDGEFNARETSAEYNGITLRVFKAETEVEAPTVFGWYFDNPFKEHVSGWRKGTGTAGWFTYEGEGTSSFAWISGVWIFGVEAGDAEARNQAAAEWVQELKGY